MLQSFTQAMAFRPSGKGRLDTAMGREGDRVKGRGQSQADCAADGRGSAATGLGSTLV
jgi:hypothetical protein